MMRAHNRQQGAALVMTLLILLILTLLASSNMERTTMQELMVNAQRDGEMTLELTEEVLREAERKVHTVVVLSDADEDGPLYAAGAAPDANDPSTWTDANTYAAQETYDDWVAEFGAKSLAVPRYYIEVVGDVEGMSQVTDVVMAGRQDMTAGDIRPTGFRIVAMSQGLSGNARRVVEVYYAGEL